MMSTSPQQRGKRGATALLVAGLASAAAWAAVSGGLFTSKTAGSAVATSSPLAASGTRTPKPDGDLAQADDKPQTYIVVFRDAPLATYQGGVAGIAKPLRREGRGRIEAKSAPARAYVTFLANKQRGYEQRIGSALGRNLKVERRMQHALNAIVTTLSPLEAEAIAQLPEVRLVEANRLLPLDTDTSPPLIGATNVWNGVYRQFNGAYRHARGKGVVVGIIDSGINFGSPSFAATDPIDGYVHVNPNGAGNYLGTCAAGGVDAGRCNDKLIGGYDFVCGAPGNTCGVANIREEPGFGDTSGHGSHTASTAAGNSRVVPFNGGNVTISGIAPRANLIAYDVCYTSLVTGQGLCPGASSAAAVDQAIADGVDVINFSIGGGSAPWNDAVSLAFLNATDAGVFVAASAGNAGPGAGTLGHVEPWTTSSAATRHRLGGFVASLSVTGPGTPPDSLQRIALSSGSGGTDLQSPLPGTTPLVVSPGIDTVDDGCTASGGFPESTFQDAIAVVRRGTCAFTEKANNAAAAGAVVIVIVNNVAGGISPSVPGATIPAFGATQAAGDALRDFAAANPGVTAAIDLTPNAVDALADFSSRGPAGVDVLKPDLAAPGVDVLAAYAGDTITGFEDLVATISGTSMASPHTAGAAALVRQLHPGWTVPEIKSALTMTAKRSVLLEDQVTPADPLAGGSGRLQVDDAARAGLVLHETTADFEAANPAIGGEPSSLNLAAIQKANCTGTCTFVRRFRNTTRTKMQWNLSLQGFSGTITPSTLAMKAGESRVVRFKISNAGAPADGTYRFGSIEIVPSQAGGGNALPSLHMPIALRVPAPPPANTIPLSNGVPVAIAGDTGSQTYFSLVVPAGATSVSFVTAGGTGDLDLFVKWGEAPIGSADCSSGTATNAESCTLIARPGTYYVRIEGYAAYSGATLTGTYQ